MLIEQWRSPFSFNFILKVLMIQAVNKKLKSCEHQVSCLHLDVTIRRVAYAWNYRELVTLIWWFGLHPIARLMTCICPARPQTALLSLRKTLPCGGAWAADSRSNEKTSFYMLHRFIWVFSVTYAKWDEKKTCWIYKTIGEILVKNRCKSDDLRENRERTEETISICNESKKK